MTSFAMRATAQYLPYSRTGAFSPLVIDYVEKGLLREYCEYEPELSSMEAAISARTAFPIDRRLLVDEMTHYYRGLPVSEKVRSNLNSLLSENTFTVCAAHQPHLFTGPLYFVYKIIHAIRLADELSRKFPDRRFVPVYFMGSEDADLDELGAVHLNGQTFRWKPGRKGAIGRMRVNHSLCLLLEQFMAALPAGAGTERIHSLLKKHFAEGVTMENATFGLVNDLFGKYGLLIFLPDRPAFKRCFLPVIRREIEMAVSSVAVRDTISTLSGSYAVRAAVRDTNLFYLTDADRERIDRSGEGFMLAKSGRRIEKQALLQLAESNPECFSPNVILRPVYQEMLLPNIAFIGGGAEVSYWLELRELFRTLRVPYPVILLRNSFLLLHPGQAAVMNAMGLNPEQLFMDPARLEKEWVASKDPDASGLQVNLAVIDTVYPDVLKAAREVTLGMDNHIAALRKAAVNRLHKNDKKRLQHLKKNMRSQLSGLHNLTVTAMPGGLLQERVENFLPWLATYGEVLTDVLIDKASGSGKEFCIISLD